MTYYAELTLNPGPDTINLGLNCTHTLTAVNTNISGPTGLPVIVSDITIDGNGSTIMRDSAMGTPDFRILAVVPLASLTLQETTINGGKTSGNFEFGGGVFIATNGTLTLTDSTISGNSTSGPGAGGGGVYNTLAP